MKMAGLAAVGGAGGGLAGATAVGGGLAGATAVVAPAYALSLLGQTSAGAKGLLGQYPTQKALAEAIRKYSAQAGGISGSAFNEESE